MQEFKIIPTDHLRKAITREGQVVVVQLRDYTPPEEYPYMYVHPVHGSRYDVSRQGRHKWGDESKDVVGWIDVLDQKPKATHTPGPWSVGRTSRDDHEYLFGIEGPGEYSYIICDLCGDGYPEDVQEANARLIAAAPELLEALKAAVAFIDSHAADNNLTMEMRMNHMQLSALNPHELISKVEGEV